MAHDIIRVTGKLQDKQIVRLFNQIEKEFGVLNVVYQTGSVRVPEEDLEELIGKRSSYFIDQANINTPDYVFQIYFKRGRSGHNHNGVTDVNVRVASPYHDEVIVIYGQSGRGEQQVPTPLQCRDLDDILKKYVTKVSPQAAGEGANGAIELLQAEIASLAELHRQMMSDTNEQRANLEKAFLEREKELEQRSEAERADITTLSEKSRAEIEGLRTELEEAKKDLDDRTPMHVRRELREKITEEIQDRISNKLLPDGSKRINSMILSMALAGALLLALLAAYSFANVSGTDSQIFWWIVRGTLAAVGAAAFLVYAIGWLRKTYLLRVEMSNDLNRYALDINRASWTIETILEMTSKEGRVLPEKWIEGVCYGLFRTRDSDKGEITPLDAWGALLNVSGNVEYGPDGTKMSFNKKQSSKLAKGSKKD